MSKTLKQIIKTFKGQGNKEQINCKDAAILIKSDVQDAIKRLGITPSLAIIQVGDDYASTKYVNNKVRTCEEVGIQARVIRVPNAASSTLRLSSMVHELNKDNSVDAIIVQLPLPHHIDADAVLADIDPKKDLDCLTPHNIGLLHLNRPSIAPCTPAGIIEMLDTYRVQLAGKNVLVIGRSHIVGRPIAELFTARDATVTLAHSRSKYNPNKYDIVVSAIGKAKAIVVDNPNAILIDVGINSDEHGKLVGDFDIEKCNCAYYTPVPGGVGPLTTAMVCKNTLTLAARRRNL